MALNPDFTLCEASPDQMDEVMRVMEVAYRNDGIWKFVRENCDDEELHEWVMKWLAPRWTMPDITTYIITEKSSGKIIAWTALQFPWKWRTEKDAKFMTPEAKAVALNEVLPPILLKEMFLPALEEFWASLGESAKHGYNPEEDYHRKGTMVQPEFQRLGLGSVLTRVTNEIMDGNPARTWAPARPSSIKMFRNMGFKDIATQDSHLERWGGTREDSITYFVRRDP
ncbi:uncharacterized protein BP5553_05308 [Venustampulla echinocandica]|uniref:N-acetyltransferase domain-containing protein n=1 Tax=Venustampulla echinocandica TaxID=2656787 RepID=A0A370TQR3_9HELO|nr:uncharacterized protein BP5553_05308 [Venustampulla echinocandica]RDL37875.1 hypothetical protein BP5553_05308 [Venustampulla echinocandica]